MSKGSASSIINSSTWSNCSLDNNDTSILAKLRRLKIQEVLLLQNVHKIMLKNYDKGEDFNMPCKSSEYKSYISNLKNSYVEIKGLFDSVKSNTTSHEALKTYDIDDIKNDVFQLEAKIKKFKNFLVTEQTLLKAEELELIKQMDVVTEASEKTIKQSKMKTKPFSEIVPSPVKNIISSPFKCQEVQQYREFLKSYRRYGGWNEYSHNVFTQSWTKHFHNHFKDSNLEIDTLEIENSRGFLNEIFEKIPGMTKEDITQHSKWYLEYLHLKSLQQEALNKWRAKKKIIKRSQLRYKVDNDITKKADCHNEEKLQNITTHVNDVVSDEMKKIEEMFLDDQSDDSIFTSDHSNESSFRHSRSAANSGQKGHMRFNHFLNRSRYTPEFDLKIERRRGVFHFAKPTQQWTNMCNDKKSQIDKSNHVLQLVHIGKLCVPKWRLHMKN